jgi:molybdenum cofactor biosynthesis enzyme MoaA
LPDSHHRIVNYFRLSVTDRCNLHYIDCKILTYEEANHGLTRSQPRKCIRPTNGIGG